MDAVEYDKMFAVEDQHFWFCGKRAWIAALLRRNIGKRVDGQILDIGCGTGGNLSFLTDWGEPFGVERDATALGYCRQRGVAGRVVASSANSLPFKDHRFALVSLLDVLYHREIEPDQALDEVRRVLAPSGYLLITDSAMPFLTSTHDEAVWARERFTRCSLRAIVETAGFEILQLSYANCFLFPAVIFARLFERWRGGGSSLGDSLPPGNRLLFSLLRTEAALLEAGINLPWGSSLVCLARRA